MPRLDKKTRAKIARIAFLAGVAIAFACHFLPHPYRAACEALSTLCTGR